MSTIADYSFFGAVKKVLTKQPNLPNGIREFWNRSKHVMQFTV